MDIKNRMRIRIGGMQYTITSEEPENYVRELADEINAALSTVMSNKPSLSMNDGLVLCLLDYADSRKKSEQNADHIREQLTGYLEDAVKARSEADDLRAEVARLKKELTLWKSKARKGTQESAASAEAGK